MIHMNSYFSVDWESSADNLKGMLKGKVTYGVLAEALCVEPKTIYNWVNNKATPNINDLVLLAKFLNVDILDILVIKGERESPITHGDVISALDKQRRAEEKLADKDAEKDYACKESVVATVLFNEYHHQNTNIRNLNEFLLYLPLCDPYILKDVLFRIQGNLKSNPDYTARQLAFLYQQIPDSSAKEYADQCREFYLKSPSVYDIGEVTKDPYKAKKVEACLKWARNKETEAACFEYEKQYSKFLKRLTLLESMKCFLEWVEQDGDS